MDIIDRILRPIRGWAMDRHIRRNVRAAVERIERNPWTHELRRVRAEVERTGDESLFADFERRFKQAERERWPMK